MAHIGRMELEFTKFSSANLNQLLLAELLGVFPIGIAIAWRHRCGAGAADAAVRRTCLLAKQQLDLIELRQRLAGDSLGQFGVLSTPLGGVERLCAGDQILIFAGQLRIARDIRPKLCDLALNLVVESLRLGLRRDFGGVVVPVGRSLVVSRWIRKATVPGSDSTASIQLAALAHTAELAAALVVATAALLIAGLLAATLLAAALALSLALSLALALLSLPLLAWLTLPLLLTLALLALAVRSLLLTLLAAAGLLAALLIASLALLTLLTASSLTRTGSRAGAIELCASQ